MKIYRPKNSVLRSLDILLLFCFHKVASMTTENVLVPFPKKYFWSARKYVKG